MAPSSAQGTHRAPARAEIPLPFTRPYHALTPDFNRSLIPTLIPALTPTFRHEAVSHAVGLVRAAADAALSAGREDDVAYPRVRLILKSHPSHQSQGTQKLAAVSKGAARGWDGWAAVPSERSTQPHAGKGQKRKK